MCDDVEPGMKTAAAVAWEPAAKISLTACTGVIFARQRVWQQRVLQQHRVTAVAAAADAGVAAAREGGGPQEAIRPSRWWSRIV